MSTISWRTIDTGCLEPSSNGTPGMDKSSLVPSETPSEDVCSLSSSILACAACLSSFILRPNSFFRSGPYVLNSSKSLVISPFLPRSLTLASSTSLAVLQFSSRTFASSCSILSFIIFLEYSYKFNHFPAVWRKTFPSSPFFFHGLSCPEPRRSSNISPTDCHSIPYERRHKYSQPTCRWPWCRCHN